MRLTAGPPPPRAIMTTDTRPKLVTRTAQIGDRQVRCTGIAKGAGMIHPNMATHAQRHRHRRAL